jgi:hypothetical protein
MVDALEDDLVKKYENEKQEKRNNRLSLKWASRRKEEITS